MWKPGDLCTACKALRKAVRWERLCATVKSGIAHPYSHSSVLTGDLLLQEYSLWDHGAKKSGLQIPPHPNHSHKCIKFHQSNLRFLLLHISYAVSCTQSLQKPKGLSSGPQQDLDQEPQSGTSVYTISGDLRVLIHDLK